MSAYGLEPSDPRRTRRAAVTRYVVAATLVRSADGAAAVGLVLLAVSPSAHLAHGARVGGVLAACLTAPHLLGPLLARRLDRARDGRGVLSTAFVAYGAALAAAALLLGRLPLAAVAAMVAAAGACGPLLTGGLSSRLAGLAGGETGIEAAQRRAEGWDAVTYGIGGTAGPALVAALAAAISPRTALLVLAGAAAAAAPLVLTLPRAPESSARREGALTVRATLRTLVAHGPLRRVGVATVLTAAAGGTLSVVAVVLGASLSDRPGAGATLVAAFGLGNLLGSLAVTAFPLRGEPERLSTRFTVLVGAAFALCAVAPGYPAALAAFAAAGAANAPWFTATLAARARYAPRRARAQVFVSLAGVKVAAAAGGTALAGAAIGLGPRAVLAAGAAIAVAAAAATAVDRRISAA
jgi:hypothetical protein